MIFGEKKQLKNAKKKKLQDEKIKFYIVKKIK